MSELPHNETLSPNPPAMDAEAARRLVRRELATRSRLGYLTLLLLAALGVAAVLSLWLTEPGLPPATHLAFAGLCAVGLAWVVFCGWVLTRRKVLYARQRIVAARLAVAFSALFSAGSLAVALIRQATGGYLASAFGLGLTAFAVAQLRRARQHHEALVQLRRSLAQQREETELAA